MTIPETCNHHTKNDGSWWEHDAAGIPLCRVCERCQKEKRARYRPEIFRLNSTYAMTGDEVDILDGPEAYS